MNKKSPTHIEPKPATSATIAVVGLGNIGSWLVALLARMREIARLILIDDDHYDTSNLVGQDITADAIDRPKVSVQAERLAAIRRGGLHITDIARRVENVPLGVLAQSDLIVGAVDSKGSRQTISELAFRLRIPYLDCGVNPQLGAARLSFFDPRHEDSACIECGWGPSDYAQLATKQPCTGTGTSETATAGNAHLGSLDASAAACAVAHFLSNGSDSCLDADATTPARQTIVGASSLRALSGGLARNPRCKFDHQAMPRETLQGFTAAGSLADFLDKVGADSDADDTAIQVPGISWIVEHRCDHCAGSTIRRPALDGRALGDAPSCPHCGAPASPVGFSATEFLFCGELLPAELESSLSWFGIEAGDFVTISGSDGDTVRCIELPLDTQTDEATNAAA